MVKRDGFTLEIININADAETKEPFKEHTCLLLLPGKHMLRSSPTPNTLCNAQMIEMSRSLEGVKLTEKI
eukprot:scaffold877_cov57-Attheya_sp.AAC.9